MIKIFDCSGSTHGPSHRAISLGPKENDIMFALKKYCGDYDCSFVDKISDCDVIITNDVFTPDALAAGRKGKPLVKRMDGIFWNKGNGEHLRNWPYNYAAEHADHVIFISEYSRESYFKLYGKSKLKANSVVLNEVDGNMFKMENSLPKRFVWTATATNWAREEKRFNDILTFAKIVGENPLIKLIGECPFDVPINVWKLGYLSEKQINKELNDSTAFLNLSYRDPAPKVVCQAVSCGLPILYANSGGTGELVHSGVGIFDDNAIRFENGTPNLDEGEIEEGLILFYQHLTDLKHDAMNYKNRFPQTMQGYFDVIKELLK